MKKTITQAHTRGGKLKGFEGALRRYFPGAYKESYFIDSTRAALAGYGFSAENTLACVSICRDEITQPFAALVREAWGEPFDLSSLAGMFFAGRTGLNAAMHHAPISGGKERYVFYALPHIAIDSEGRIGVCRRRGRKELSTACGALDAIQKEMASGRMNPAVENSDVEQSLIRIRLMREIPYGSVPDLLELTKLVQKAAQSDLEGALTGLVDAKKSDYALTSGIQIHGPDGNYVWPAAFYAVVRGRKIFLKFTKAEDR